MNKRRIIIMMERGSIKTTAQAFNHCILANERQMPNELRAL